MALLGDKIISFCRGKLTLITGVEGIKGSSSAFVVHY
jgi:hypothetical protein